MLFVLPKPNNGLIRHDYVNDYIVYKEKVTHEYLFLKYLQKEILKDPDLAALIYMYIYQYHPNYTWKTPYIISSFIESKYSGKKDELRDDILIEIQYHLYQFMQYIKIDNTKKEELGNSMHFGEIATEFLIRYKNYSLIDYCNTKIILTAQDDCSKRFKKYLEQGYSLFRISKLYFNPDVSLYSNHDTFSKLPVLPSKEDWIDEIIEAPNGSYVQIPKTIPSNPYKKERKR